MSHDVATIGEAMLRYWVPAGERIESAHRFAVGVAGAEANTSVALARLGRSVAWISALPDNPLGRRTARALAAQGVSVSHVVWRPDSRMGTYYVELSVPPRPPTVMYDRSDSAASTLTADDVDWDVVAGASVAYLTGITPALSETCRNVAAEFMRRAHQADATVVFDLNYRLRLWDAREASAVLGELCRLADVMIVTDEDARDLFSISGEPAKVLEGMAEATGVERIVLTRGASGASWMQESDVGHVDGIAAEVVDPIGAGDAFAAGVINGILEEDIGAGVELGAAMGAIEVGLYGDMFTVDRTEVEALIQGGNRDVER